MMLGIVDLVTQPQMLAAALFLVGAVFGIAAAWLAASFRQRERKKPAGAHQRGRRAPIADIVPGPWSRRAEAVSTRPVDAADQLRVVMTADFSARPLLNKSETRVFQELHASVASRNPSWRVMVQVSLGEILRSQDSEAYRCINSKRVDLLLVDENCQPRHVIEYQGSGHHQGTAAARDAVKKEALRRAGIGYHEVIAGQTTPSDLRRLVEKLVENSPICPTRDQVDVVSRPG